MPDSMLLSLPGPCLRCDDDDRISRHPQRIKRKRHLPESIRTAPKMLYPSDKPAWQIQLRFNQTTYPLETYDQFLNRRIPAEMAQLCVEKLRNSRLRRALFALTRAISSRHALNPELIRDSSRLCGCSHRIGWKRLRLIYISTYSRDTFNSLWESVNQQCLGKGR